MLSAILDIALLLVSGTACLYCYVLSRRLRALQDLKKGLGASIVSLSEAISKTMVAAQEARVSAGQSADKLSRLMSDIDKSVPVVDDLIESINRSTRRAANETTRMQDEAIATIRPLLEEARSTAANLADVLALIDARSEKLQEEAQALEDRARDLHARDHGAYEGAHEREDGGADSKDAATPVTVAAPRPLPSFGKVRMAFSLSDTGNGMAHYTARPEPAAPAPAATPEEADEEEAMDPSNPFAQHIKRLRAARDAAEGRRAGSGESHDDDPGHMPKRAGKSA